MLLKSWLQMTALESSDLDNASQATTVVADCLQIAREMRTTD